MKENEPTKELIQEIAMKAGKLLLEAGSEAHRVEDTMYRITKYYGYFYNQCYVSSTIINFALDKNDNIKVYRVKKRDTNLNIIHQVNTLSRKLVNGELTALQALQTLDQLSESDVAYTLVKKVIASGFISIFFLYLFKGNIEDTVATFIAGAVGYYTVEIMHKFTKVKFIAEIIGSAMIAIIGLIGQIYLNGDALNLVIISAVMPIVPGVLITNAIQDLFLGHFLVGISKGLEATLTACAIGAGVGLVLSLV